MNKPDKLEGAVLLLIDATMFIGIIMLVFGIQF